MSANINPIPPNADDLQSSNDPSSKTVELPFQLVQQLLQMLQPTDLSIDPSTESSADPTTKPSLQNSAETKKSHDFPELNFQSTQFCSRRFIVYLTTASKDLRLEKRGTGDIDFRNTLAKAYDQLFPEMFYLIEKNNNEEEIFNLIEQTKATQNPILHIIINAPNTGCLFKIDSLKSFKKAGGKLVLTILEHEKHTAVEFRATTNDYIALADHCIFLDEFDKKSALESICKLETLGKIFDVDPYQLSTVNSSSIIPVPATVQLKTLPFSERGTDILIFCMFRYGAGYKPTIELAKLLKTSNDPLLQKKQIWRVGSLFDHNEDDALLKLMLDIYPDRAEELKGCTHSRLKFLLAKYHHLEKEGLLKRALPIRLVVDCTENELLPIFNACQFAFSPKYNGADLRHSSTSTLLSHRFIVISHVGKKTPACLLEKGEHHQAVVLFQAKETIEDKICQEYARFAYEAIKERTYDPRLNEEAQKQIQKLMDAYLDLDRIAEQYIAIYEKIFKRKISELQPQVQRIREKWLLFQRIKNFAYKERAFKSFEKHQKIKLDELNQNFRRLMATLRSGAGDFTPSMQTLLATKLPHETLLPLEKKLLLCLVRENKLRFRHKTAYLSDIKKETVLTSVDERVRRQPLPDGELKLSKEEQIALKRKKVNSHTPLDQGYTDFVFATYGSYNPRAPYFLYEVQDEIIGDMEVIVENNPYLLTGAHVSDHYAAFGLKNTTALTPFLDRSFSIEYDGRTKQISYNTKPDGTRKQPLNFGDECFAFPQIDIALYLMFILKLRYFGKETHEMFIQTVLDNPSNDRTDLIEEALQTLFHPGIFEFHIPCKLRVDQFGIKHSRTVNAPVKTMVKNTRHWFIINTGCFFNRETYLLSTDQHSGFPSGGMFPFLRSELTDDCCPKSFIQNLNANYSLNATEENFTIQELCTGQFGSRNVYHQDIFYLCKLSLTQPEWQYLERNKKVEFITIDRSVDHGTEASFLNAEDYSMPLNSKRLTALPLFMLNLAYRIRRNHKDLLERASEIFKRLYQKTYSMHYTLLQDIIDGNEESLDKLNLNCLNPLSKLTRNVDDTISLYDAAVHYNRYNFKITFQQEIDRYKLQKNLYQLNPFFIKVYKEATAEARSKVSIVDVLLWKYKGSPWRDVDDLEEFRDDKVNFYISQIKRHPEFSFKDFIAFLKLALENEPLSVDDYEQLIYITYLYLEQGCTIVLDTVLSFIDFPLIKNVLEKRLEEVRVLEDCSLFESSFPTNEVPLSIALEKLDLYWKEQQKGQVKQQDTKERLDKTDLNDRPPTAGRLAMINLKMCGLKPRMRLSSALAISILIAKNRDGELCFILDFNSNHYYPFLQETIKDPYLSEESPNAFDQLNCRYALGYNPDNIQWHHLGRAYTSLGRTYNFRPLPQKHYYHSFHVGFLSKITHEQLFILESSPNIVMLPAPQLESYLNQHSEDPKLLTASKMPITEAAPCLNPLTASLLRHIIHYLPFLPNSLWRNKPFHQLFSESFKSQEFIVKTVTTETLPYLDRFDPKYFKQQLTNANVNMADENGRNPLEINIMEFKLWAERAICVDEKGFLSLKKPFDDKSSRIYSNWASEFPICAIRRLRILLACRAKVDLKYFKNIYCYVALLLANCKDRFNVTKYNDPFDFTNHYKALDQKARDECFKTAYMHLAQDATILYRFVDKTKRENMAQDLLEKHQGEPLDGSPVLSPYFNAIYKETDCRTLYWKFFTDELYADLVAFSLRSQDMNDEQVYDAFIMAATLLAVHKSAEVANAIVDSMDEALLIDKLDRCMDYFTNKSTDRDRLEIVEDLKKAKVVLAVHWKHRDAEKKAIVVSSGKPKYRKSNRSL